MPASGETLTASPRSCSTASHYTYFHDRADRPRDGATLDSGALAGGVLRRASLLGLPSLAGAAFWRHGARDPQSPDRPASHLSNAVMVSPADGSRRSRSRSTATTSARSTEARYSILPQALNVVS